ncbi:hypothetical protein HBI56_008960 [Parastagonospora nodorum]|uniref:Alpha-L-rhamnosidase six-hairpin glycosidase domain-containing protein n=1 Tax=Phaeosphaeria nodorum (strain SN15 / ATCC MYA-4574 / FGSC 10173) TaxID=321614 RepID=A0A7U2EQ10_PHANO|nr:hypothetical protein HBH56_236430 [Parastagonospora nodorum]QRC90923.1 hypothetical protein JI435_004380 [Parastagonospora nodorum SN15]KAH3934878.1 hypothetical protein HBH54_046300 [Parastagonospora nodorum]KAH3986742.1 hypothetical protein HBH51_010710 [Parastagonospora nodorum]KAH4000979.1 hypothetical protein HBI10_096370 [Parastagonospora nodorum]
MGGITIEAELQHGINFSQPSFFDLRTHRPNKTIDIGRDGLSLSLDAKGRVLQASAYHPEHGIIVANPFRSFDGSRFYDVPYVRDYRTRMLQWIQNDRPGFGLDFGVPGHLVSIKIIETNVALYHMKLVNHVDVSLTAHISAQGSFVQDARATNTSSGCVLLPYALGVNVSLNRASYGQLTEGGPIALPPGCNILRKSGPNTLRVYNPNLGAQLSTSLDINGQPLVIDSVEDQDASEAVLDVFVKGKVCILPGETATFCATFRLIPDAKEHTDVFQSGMAISKAMLPNAKSRWKRDEILTTYVLRRNFEYILANCVVPISESSTVILTDHVALPLGWNRDNYWQVRLLLETHANITDLVYSEFVPHYRGNIESAVRGHLKWVFIHAKRPHGFWHRSYLANGQPKDRSIFQLDQQCYPLLELCDYAEHFPSQVDFVKRIVDAGVIHEILAVLAAKQDKQTRLWPTDETPGDDAVQYPHHFSSHILMWRTFTRLHQMFLDLAIPLNEQISRLEVMAAQLKNDTVRSFTTTHSNCSRPLFAYLTDGNGHHECYHDGNDVPTAFAYDWGFASSASEITTWRATMDFALSPANAKGFCDEGPYGGLGSVHSPGAWTLGYFQELAYAASSNNVIAMQGAWTKIAAAMQWDGTFPEAVDPKTAQCTSKAWFSWPGAMIGALLIHMKKNGQEEILLQTRVKVKPC